MITDVFGFALNLTAMILTVAKNGYNIWSCFFALWLGIFTVMIFIDVAKYKKKRSKRK
ncbi:MAG: hypothetical protein IKU30_04830 [Clostridia bacterium]|nr:hypothetical protein [Clostridia bacterium]